MSMPTPTAAGARPGFTPAGPVEGVTLTPEVQAVVESAIRSTSHIATLPEITLRIIRLVEDPATTAQDLHKVIQNDPALCSRILKVVNSAFYGLSRQVASINRAIVLLGLNAVKNIAIAASLTRLFRGGDLCPRFSARDLWTHSVATAAASKLICDQLKFGLADEAFLAGLIHDIGLMVEMQAARSRLLTVFERMTFDAAGTPLNDMRAIERQVIGADHCAFGAALCTMWKFPRSFSLVAGSHHDPLSLPPGNRTLAAVVCVADRMAAECGYGFRADLETTLADPNVLEELRLGAQAIESVRGALPRIVDEVQTTFV